MIGRWGCRSCRDGAPAIEAAGITKRFRGSSGERRRGPRPDALGVAAVSGSPSSAPTVPGSRPRSRCSPASCTRPPATARVLGLVPWQQRRALAERIGTLFGQRSQLWFELSPRQSLRMLAAIYGLDRARERAGSPSSASCSTPTDLFDQPVRDLSLGQRMRCELAACLLHEPDILFLDEPTIGLDLLAKRRFRELLVTLNEARRHDRLPHLARRRRHRARRPAGRRHQRRPAHLRRRRRRRCAARCCRPSWSTSGLERAGDAARPRRRHGRRRRATTSAAARRSTPRAPRSARCSARVLDAWSVSDISVVDPPLEQVIAEIYSERRT